MSRAVIERLAWRFARLVFGCETVAGIRFIDARARRAPDQVHATLEGAAETLRLAGAEFVTLVRDEIGFVAATREPRPRVSVTLRAYLSPFTGHERWNSQLLAAHLVWAAAYLGEHRKAGRERRPFDRDVAFRCGKEQQIALAGRLPNADRWMDYLDGLGDS